MAGKLSGKGRKKCVTFLTIFASIGIGIGFALANYVYMILALKELLNWNTRGCSFLIFCALVIILWKVVEPERIKPIAVVLSLVIFGSGKIQVSEVTQSACLLAFTNLANYVFSKRASDIVYWDISHSGGLIGLSLYCFESISSIINGNSFPLT